MQNCLIFKQKSSLTSWPYCGMVGEGKSVSAENGTMIVAKFEIVLSYYYNGLF